MRRRLHMDFRPFLWADEQLLRHFPPSSCPRGTSCKCLQETQSKHSVIQRSNVKITATVWRSAPRDGDLLLDWDLAVLVGVKRKADVSVNRIFKNKTKQNRFRRCGTNSKRSPSVVQRHKPGGHSHFLQENLSARVVPRGVVGDRQDVIGPVLWRISPPNTNKHISSDVSMSRCAEDSNVAKNN